MNCVRRLWFSGPLSRSSRHLRTWGCHCRFSCHHCASRSTMKSLVTLEEVKNRLRSLCADRGGRQPAVQPGGLEGRVGLEVVGDDVADVLEEGRQMHLRRLAAAGGEVVNARDPGVQLVQRLADGVTGPAEPPCGHVLA